VPTDVKGTFDLRLKYDPTPYTVTAQPATLTIN
jgi:hypothetical protein